MRLSVVSPQWSVVRLIVLVAAVIGSAGVSAAGEPAGFTVALLPDTQLYSEKFPDTYIAQTEWIKHRAGRDNIKFVIHLGDIVEHAGAEREWENADRAHRVLDGAVPYSILPGNHDMNDKRETPLYNKYFSPARFEKCPWYGGHEDETNDNNYCFFHAAGMKFMVLSLEFNPTDQTLKWAGKVLGAQRDCRVIVATHEYMDTKGRRDAGNNVWNRFLRKHGNIFMVVSGHVLGVGHQTSTNDAGGKVHEILCDYQGLPNGGNGWLQTLRFVPAENKIYVEAYSPLLDKHNKHPEHTYTLDYEMSVAKGGKGKAEGPPIPNP